MNSINKDDQQQHDIRKGIRILWLILGSVAIIVVVACLVAVIYTWQGLQPQDKTDQASEFVIPVGAQSSEIAHILKDRGLIRNELVFRYYLLYYKQGNQFKAGTYAMTPGISIPEIIQKLNQGDVIPISVNRLTIPEGLTIEQIIQVIATQSQWKVEDLRQAIDRPEQFDLPILADLPNNKAFKHRMEGYLFPDTYEVPEKVTAKEFVAKLLQEMDRKLATLPSDWQEQMKAKGLTLHQLLTIASLIEREVVVPEERELVASVIYNRLNIQMALQIDATVQYALDKPKARLLYEDLKVQSPFNTYLYAGLPPGPIASPSLASIRAALYPANTKYLYYVTKKDGTQAHLFATSYAQHLKNIRLSEKNNK